MRILILDPNKLFGVGVQHFLQASLPDTCVDHAECDSQVASLLGAEPFALLVMEIGTANDKGLRVLKRLRSEYPRLPLLVLSDYPEDYYGPRVIRAGACGFIGKDSEPEELLRAVKCVLKGKHYVSPDLADRLAHGLRASNDGDPPHEKLSAREFQIFRRLALGQPMTHIARALDLSVKTVDTHRSRILYKMGIGNREGLSRYAFEHGLISSRRLGERLKTVSSS